MTSHNRILLPVIFCSSAQIIVVKISLRGLIGIDSIHVDESDGDTGIGHYGRLGRGAPNAKPEIFACVDCCGLLR